MNVNYEYYRVFYHVAKLKSFTQAAEVLMNSQPNITRTIRSLEREDRGLPIIAMTANAFVEDVQMAKNTGMSEHIAKPLDMDRLCAILNRYLKKP